MSENYVKGSCYLIVCGVNRGSNAYPAWELSGFTARKNKPAVDANEVAIKISLSLPVALFKKPTLEASIGIEGDVPVIDLTPETVSTIEDVIRSETDLNVRLEVGE